MAGIHYSTYYCSQDLVCISRLPNVSLLEGPGQAVPQCQGDPNSEGSSQVVPVRQINHQGDHTVQRDSQLPTAEGNPENNGDPGHQCF